MHTDLGPGSPIKNENTATWPILGKGTDVLTSNYILMNECNKVITIHPPGYYSPYLEKEINQNLLLNMDIIISPCLSLGYWTKYVKQRAALLACGYPLPMLSPFLCRVIPIPIMIDKNKGTLTWGAGVQLWHFASFHNISPYWKNPSFESLKVSSSSFESSHLSFESSFLFK